MGGDEFILPIILPDDIQHVGEAILVIARDVGAKERHRYGPRGIFLSHHAFDAAKAGLGLKGIRRVGDTAPRFSR